MIWRMIFWKDRFTVRIGASAKRLDKGSIILVGIQMLTVTKTNHGKQRVSRASISRDAFAAIRVT